MGIAELQTVESVMQGFGKGCRRTLCMTRKPKKGQKLTDLESKESIWQHNCT